MAILSKKNETYVLIAGSLVVGYGLYKVSSAAEGAATAVKELVTEDLNPVSDKNIVNTGVSSLVDRFTDGAHKSLGSYMFCLFNKDAIICNSEMLKSASALDISFYSEDENGNNIINPQLKQLYEQEQEFYEEDVL